MKRFFLKILPGSHFYYGIAICVLFFVLSYFITFLFPVALVVTAVFAGAILLDLYLLFFTGAQVAVQRDLPVRLSNGETNQIRWQLKNEFGFKVFVRLIDEWPIVLQMRDWKRDVVIEASTTREIAWTLRPVKRGEYDFGDIHLLVQSRLKLVRRKIDLEAEATVPCYPAFKFITRKGFFSNAVIENAVGSRRLRKIGQSLEFEQIKNYVNGDDIRRLNWKASAKTGTLMVNQYAYERAQRIFSVIDKGRLMKMPFSDLTLLDYAINSSLVLSSVALRKRDKVGLITFSNTVDTSLPADNRPTTLNRIMENLYKQETNFLESSFEALYQTVRNKVRGRSLLILYTNFESLTGMQRQLGYLKTLAKYHLLVVVFFENTELKSLIKKSAVNLPDIYNKTIAEKFVFEKRLIVRELNNNGITAILTKPNELTVSVINKYLELKFSSAL